MGQLAEWICAAISQRDDERALRRLAEDVESLCARYPVPGLCRSGEAFA